MKFIWHDCLPVRIFEELQTNISQNAKRGLENHEINFQDNNCEPQKLGCPRPKILEPKLRIAISKTTDRKNWVVRSRKFQNYFCGPQISKLRSAISHSCTP
jgi:hypothetical protein